MAKQPTVWELREEDVEYHAINVLGIFSSRSAAVKHLVEMITKEIQKDKGGYMYWVDSSNEDAEVEKRETKDLSMKSYVTEQVRYLSMQIERWINALDAPIPKDWRKARELEEERAGVEWGCALYSVKEVPSFL